MEPTSFTFGMLTIVALVFITLTVVCFLKVINLQKELNTTIDITIPQLETVLSREIESLHSRLDSELDSVVREITGVQDDLTAAVQECTKTCCSYTDKRFDKVKDTLPNLLLEVEKPKSKKSNKTA
jgi:hypothetical protein